MPVHDAPAVAPEDSAAAHHRGDGYRSFVPYHLRWRTLIPVDAAASAAFATVEIASEPLPFPEEFGSQAGVDEAVGEDAARAKLTAFLAGPGAAIRCGAQRSRIRRDVTPFGRALVRDDRRARGGSRDVRTRRRPVLAGRRTHVAQALPALARAAGFLSAAGLVQRIADRGAAAGQDARLRVRAHASATRRVAQRPNGISAGRCRHPRTPRDGLDAPARAGDRGVVSVLRPGRRLAGRARRVGSRADRGRTRAGRRQLAVGRRRRRRPRGVSAHLQSAQAGAPFRSVRNLRSAMDSRAGRASPTQRCSKPRPDTGMRSSSSRCSVRGRIPRRSSITRAWRARFSSATPARCARRPEPGRAGGGRPNAENAGMSDQPARAAHDAAAPENLLRFMTSGWATPPRTPVSPIEGVERFAARRDALSRAFPGETLIVPTGRQKIRANDTAYKFPPRHRFLLPHRERRARQRLGARSRR